MSAKKAKSLPVVGYYEQPLLKPPVWTWEVPLYFWFGGTSGMAALLALASLVGSGSLELARTSLWIAAIGAVLSPVLLILDLGRPLRFLHMLRVLKPRSPMSVGVWTLIVFSAASFFALFLFESFGFLVQELELPKEVLSTLLTIAMIAAGTSGALLATYTGVLLGATVIPAWSSHSRMLPVHFGIASLGSAASLLIVIDSATSAIELIGLAAAITETVLLAIFETVRQGDRDRALRTGSSGRLVRLSGILLGPVPLLLWMLGAPWLASALFLLGALVSRFAWVAAGRASALDPHAVFEPA